MKPVNTQYFAQSADSPGHTPVYRRVGDDGRKEEIDKRTDLRNHSPDGFSWGYSGSGPAQLSLAILADFYEDDQVAMDCYQQFKDDVVAQYHEDAPFFVTGADIVEMCGEH